MKKIIMIMVLAAISSATTYGQKCKPGYKDKDKFTGVTTEFWGGTITSMSWYTGDIKYLPSLYVANMNGENKITFSIAIDGKLNNNQVLNNQVWFEKGTKFYIKLENEILEFEVDYSKIINHTSKTYVGVYSSITAVELEKLNTQKLEMGRVLPFKDSDDIQFQFNIASGRDKMFKRQLSCFLNQ